MNILRIVARPLLASAFIADGVAAVRDPQTRAERLAPVWEKLHQRVSVLPAQPATAVRALGAVEVAAGALLALGVLPRVSAATLALVAGTQAIAENPLTDRRHRRENLSRLWQAGPAVAGAIFAAADRQGKPSLAWRAENWRLERHEDRERNAHLREQQRQQEARILAQDAELAQARRQLRAEQH